MNVYMWCSPCRYVLRNNMVWVTSLLPVCQLHMFDTCDISGLSVHWSMITTGYWWKYTALKPTECLRLGWGRGVGDCKVTILKSWPWTIVSNMFREYHSPCVLNTSVVDIEKLKTYCSYYKRLNILSLPTPP